jgi:FG-GAP repeat protein
LSGDGNTLAVGAPQESSSLTGVRPGAVDETTAGNGAPNSGAAYVFTRAAGAWSQQAYVKASNTGSDDQFGFSVALSGDGNRLAVGAPFEDSNHTGVDASAVSDASAGNASPDSGAAYVFARGVNGVWSQEAYVKASNTGSNDQFGTSVALSGDGNTLVAGSPLESSIGTGIGSASDELAPGSGAAYVYVRSGSAWSQKAFVKASNTDAGDGFGNAVALSDDGNTLAVGAPAESGSSTGISITGIDNTDNNLQFRAGAAYLY